jgi:hypothetical protein
MKPILNTEDIKKLKEFKQALSELDDKDNLEEIVDRLSIDISLKKKEE